MANEPTRIARLEPRAERSRPYRENQGTFFRGAELFVRPSVNECLDAQRRAMEKALAAHAQPGVLVYAVDDRREFAGELWLSAGDDWRAGSIGRHTECQLMLPDAHQTALRQLLLLVRRGECRLVDLNTPAGFSTASGRVLEQVQLEGWQSFRVEGVTLFVLPTGGAPVDWAKRGRFKSSIVKQAREFPALAESNSDGAIDGRLVLQASGSSYAWNVTHAQLDRGLVLGTYDRCFTRGVKFPTEVSRVHALVLRLNGEVWLFDAGSSNGTWRGDAEITAARMEEGEVFRLAETGTTVWGVFT